MDSLLIDSDAEMDNPESRVGIASVGDEVGKNNGKVPVKMKSKSKKPYKCTYGNCKYTFDRDSNLKKHLFMHSSKRSFDCENCDKTYKTKSDLVRHSRLKHSTIVKNINFIGYRRDLLNPRRNLWSADYIIDKTDQLHDIYICYNSKDENWVNQLVAWVNQEDWRESMGELGDFQWEKWVNRTELKPAKYRLCLHHKFPVAVDNISHTIESSQRTILVISNNLLQNEWFEYKSALLQNVLLRKNISGIKTIYAILLDELPEIDPDLRMLLKSVVILSPNDKLFLSNLKALLPEPRKPSLVD